MRSQVDLSMRHSRGFG